MIITKAASTASTTPATTVTPGLSGGSAGTGNGNTASTSTGAVGASNSASATTSSAAVAASVQTTAAEQSDRFLKLLVAQMRNQDPLNPLDNAAVTSQMAQISTVEGVEKLNKTMSQYLDRGNGLSSLDGAALIGRRVLVKGDSLAIGTAAADGTRASAQGGFELTEAAPRATIDILDASGAVIASQQQTGLAAGVHRFDWDGTTSAGAAAAAGSYTFRVSAGTAAAPLSVTTLQAKQVTAVISGSDGPRLEIGGSSQLTVADVRAILQEKN
jgi:flagellar basal-body rod modification protein FlgD